MGLMDFFKKRVEKPVEQKPKTTTVNPPGHQQPRSSAPEPAPEPKSAAREYTIKSGDSLSKIAKRFYGDPNDWQKLYQANKDKISDPDLIHPGQKIIIP